MMMMKFSQTAVFLFFYLISSCGVVVSGDPLELAKEQVTKLREVALEEGKKSQKEYDEVACGCEKDMSETREKITNAKNTIAKLNLSLETLSGQVGEDTATVSQLKKDISENADSVSKTQELRAKQEKEFLEMKTETEQCLSALGKAITALSGGQKGTFETSLAAMSQARMALSLVPKKALLADETQLVSRFLLESTSSSPNLLQQKKISKHNPLGDYAPQSTAILGILKNMEDTFTKDLSDAVETEKKDKKTYEELLEAKQDEGKTLAKQFGDNEKRLGENKAQKSEDTLLRQEKREELQNLSISLTDITSSCKDRAREHATNSRLRTEEIAGFTEGLRLVDEIFKLRSKSSFFFFLQKYQDKLKDKLTPIQKAIYYVDKLITTLREEDKEDLSKKDECEAKKHQLKLSLNAAKNKKESLLATKSRQNAQLTDGEVSLKENLANKKAAEKTLEDAQKQQKIDTKTYQDARELHFKSSALLDEAIAAVEKFYRDNKNDAGGAYEGQSAGKTLIAVLKQAKNSEQSSIAQLDDAFKSTTDDFNKIRDAQQNLLETYHNAAVELDLANAKLESKIGYTQEDADSVKNIQTNLQTNLDKDWEKNCSWVAEHYDSRVAARNDEISGLQGAKEVLQQVQHIDQRDSV